MERSRPDHGLTTTQGRSLLEQMRRSSRGTVWRLLLVFSIYALLLFLEALPGSHLVEAAHEEAQTSLSLPFVPPLWALTPFALLLFIIAVFPLLSQTQDWWHHNRNRFLVAVILGGSTLLYYGLLHPGGLENHFTHLASSTAGWETLWTALSNAIFSEFIPFIVLLFSLYVISGGINLSGDLPAHPATNTAFIALGAILASFIGTTGAAMVLIRPLILTNIEREYKIHTILFFIFCACNCGGLLLPIGDPPLFLGYLRGVPFTWTLVLWPYWLLVNSILLAVLFRLGLDRVQEGGFARFDSGRATGPTTSPVWNHQPPVDPGSYSERGPYPAWTTLPEARDSIRLSTFEKRSCFSS